jgi:hypothetical protein
VVVVFPLVPVTPAMIMEAAGSPNQFRPSRARAARLSGTTTQGPSPSGFRWQRTQAAPFSRAMGMNRWPSVS